MTDLRRVRDDSVTQLTDVFVTTGRLPSGWNEATEPAGGTIDFDLIHKLTTKAASLLPNEQLDGWLAPRLHNALRIPRRLAADGPMWTWLALQCPEFIEARFGKSEGKVHPWRYRTVWSRNGLSRLWWGAEMTRNGPHYEHVPLCFSRTRTAQFALELMYSWCRPAAIAFVRVSEGADAGSRLNDSQMKALSTRLKVYLSMRSLESLQGSQEDLENFDLEWSLHTPSLTDLLKPDVSRLVGPSKGVCGEDAIRGMCTWFRQIAAEAASDGEETEIDAEAASKASKSATK
jgi:hypothetical protein